MKQQTFGFVDDEPKPGSTKLAITVKGKGALSKKQIEFNRLTKKIEVLRKKLVSSGLTLDAHLAYYGAHIRPLELELISVKRTHLALLIPYVTEKKMLTKGEKRAVKDYASSILQDLMGLLDEEPDEELKEVFKVLYGRNFDEVQAEEMESMQGELEEMFSDMGYNVDLGGLNAKMKPEELAAKLAELKDTFDEQEGAAKQEHTGKKKTKKQLARELQERQMEEVRKKSINTIYRQLAKVLHPDLESDPEVRMKKEDVMKELTSAYEANDLHTLLRLEIEWMEKQENNINSLTDEKLSVYNNVLKEQIENLEEEVYELGNHPRYMPLMRFMDMEDLLQYKTLVHKKTEITELIQAVQDTINFDLGGNAALKYIKELAHYQMKQNQHQKEMEKYFKDILDF